MERCGKTNCSNSADAGGNELSIAAARNSLDRNAERLAGLGQPLAAVAEIAESWALEAAIGELTQHRNDS
jgi:hypothetical protein